MSGRFPFADYKLRFHHYIRRKQTYQNKEWSLFHHTKKISEEDFARRITRAYEIIKKCTSCPRNCLADRTNGEFGTCQSRDLPIVSFYTPHFGEEPVLSGTRGAGNIFFGNCNLRCDYCQNFVVSQNPKAEITNEVLIERFSDIMLDLQNMNCQLTYLHRFLNQ